MTLEEAIAHCLEVAEKNETSAITYKNCKEIKTNMYEKLTAEKAENDCRECATGYRQLAVWLTELKEAKRLLKAAVEALNDGSCNKDCRQCESHKSCDYDNRFKWKHTNAVLKLIEEKEK